MHPDYTTDQPPDSIPYGYCHCGCGQKTRIAPWNSKEKGWIKGEPVRFVSSHNTRLRKQTIPIPNPSGRCQCGCGQETPVARWSNIGRGIVEGEHVRFIPGHNMRQQIPPPNPSGLCQCGCGQEAPIALHSKTASNTIKGQHVRFLPGHGTRIPVRQRFWANVRKAGPDECWEWAGTVNAGGYGVLSDGRQRRLFAHRLSYELHYGPVPLDLRVLHKCDNPPCCNPAHLYAGTPKDNLRDARERGRLLPLRGSRNAWSKLTESIVQEIRQARAAGTSCTELARRYDVASNTISAVARGKSWKHVK